MLALNNLSDVRDLEVGSIFLVPPKNGTFTPTPAESTHEVTVTPEPPTITPTVPFLPVREATLIVTPLDLMTVSATPNPIATVGSPPTIVASAEATATPEPVGTEVAMVVSNPQPNPPAIEPPAPRGNNNLVIGIAVVVQLLIVAVAAVEFVRRARRGKRR
jgi:hypothetical protein